MDNVIKELWEVFSENLSGEKAKEYSVAIWEKEKYFSSDKDIEAVSWYIQKMKALGLKRVEEVQLPADGKSSFGGIVMPKLWKVKKAKLRIISPVEETIADYEKTPCNLMLYSSSTPEDGLKFSIKRENEITEEKAVFGNIEPKEGADLILNNKAKILVSDYLCCHKGASHGAVQWHNFTINPFYSQPCLGFSISPLVGERIRGWLKEGKEVRFWAYVNTEIEEGSLPLPTGFIPGKTEEEILLTGHLFEEGMADNSSGCGLALEIMGIIKKLIKEGRLPAPKRGIRLLPSFECRGIQIYSYLHPERMEKIKAGLDIDMVSPESKYPIRLVKTPSSHPDYTDYFLSYLLDFLSKNSEHKWKEQGYGLNDSLISDPLIGIPTPAIGIVETKEMEYYHNSLDTPEFSSAYTFKNIGIVAATFLYFLADSTLPEARWLADIVSRRMMKEPPSEFKLNKVFDSLVGLVSEEETPELNRHLENLKEKIRVSEKKEEPSEEEGLKKDAEKIIPKRKFKGLVGFDDLDSIELSRFKELIGENPHWISPTWLNEALFLANGKRNLLRIKEILIKEGLNLNLKKLISYFTFLREKGKIEWRR